MQVRKPLPRSRQSPCQKQLPPPRPAQTTPNADAVSHGKTILLWPDGAPKAAGKTPGDTPTLTVFLPAKNTTKTGVIVAPGGGYQNLAMQHEGEDIARWLNLHGVAAFVLKYRLGPVYHHPIELGDAQRALRLVRLNAKDYGIAPRPHRHVGLFGRRASRRHGGDAL